MKLKKFKTKKLFWGEWPYKISTGVVGAYSIAQLKFDNVTGEIIYPTYFHRAKSFDDARLLEYYAIYSKYAGNTDIKTRAEFNTINYFVKDKDLYEAIIQDFGKFVTSVTEPANQEELDLLLSKNKVILCDEYPKDKFAYRVNFKTLPDTVRSNLMNWLSNQPTDTVFANQSTLRYLSGTSYWCSNTNFYISDKRQLTFIGLLVNGQIRSIEEFVLRSSINTVS